MGERRSVRRRGGSQPGQLRGGRSRRHGGAQISPKHANFILNLDHASAADVLALVDIARDEVASRFGVVLEREIVVIGDPMHVTAAARTTP